MGSLGVYDRCAWKIGYAYAVWLHARGELDGMVRRFGPFRVRVKAGRA